MPYFEARLPLDIIPYMGYTVAIAVNQFNPSSLNLELMPGQDIPMRNAPWSRHSNRPTLVGDPCSLDSTKLSLSRFLGLTGH